MLLNLRFHADSSPTLRHVFKSRSCALGYCSNDQGSRLTIACALGPSFLGNSSAKYSCRRFKRSLACDAIPGNFLLRLRDMQPNAFVNSALLQDESLLNVFLVLEQ